MDEIYYVYVVDDDQRLRGVFPLKKMITQPSVSKVKHVMRKEPISVHVDTPIDEVVQTIEKYDLVRRSGCGQHRASGGKNYRR